jgi:transposase
MKLEEFFNLYASVDDAEMFTIRMFLNGENGVFLNKHFGKALHNYSNRSKRKRIICSESDVQKTLEMWETHNINQIAKELNLTRNNIIAIQRKHKFPAKNVIRPITAGNKAKLTKAQQQSFIDMEEYTTTKELCEIFNIKHCTVSKYRRLIKEGKPLTIKEPEN